MLVLTVIFLFFKVHKGTKETRERQVKPQLLKGKRVNLVRTAPMVWMGLVEKRAREVHPDLLAMLDFKDSKVSKGLTFGLKPQYQYLSIDILPVHVT